MSRDLNPRDAALRLYEKKKHALLLMKSEGMEAAVTKYPELNNFLEKVKDFNVDDIINPEKIDSILRSF